MSATKDIIIALDEGTTNAKAVALDGRGNVVAKFSRALAIHTPREGWLNSPATRCWRPLAVMAQAVAAVGTQRRRWRSAISEKRQSAGIAQAGVRSAPPLPAMLAHG